MTLYKNKYRIESARLKGWDYRTNGFYFVTICTHDRQHFFGDVVNGEMQLSAIGEIVAQEWEKTPQIRPYVIPDEWVVMPNHFHAIVAIHNQPPVETFRRNVSTTDHGTHRNAPTTNHGTPQNPVETTRRVVSTDNHGTHRNVPTNNATGLKSKSLGAIIGQFKSVCTKQIWALGYSDFRWQPRFYDHIIRDESALMNIRQYIADNPLKWHLDRENSANLYM